MSKKRTSKRSSKPSISKKNILDGFKVEIEIDNDGTVYASIYDSQFVLLGQGKNYDEAFQCLSEQLTLALDDIENDKKYSGKLNLRMPSTMHAQIAKLAELRGESLNDLIIEGISKTLPIDNIS